MNSSNREVSTYLGTYAPTQLSHQTWAPLRSTVLAAAAVASPTLAALRKNLPALAVFSAWLATEGVDVDVADLANLDLVERYIQVGMPDRPDSTRANRRALLRRLARQLDPEPASLPEQIVYRRAKPPYQPSEVARFFDLAAAQPTESLRNSFSAILVLGLGCGLDRADFAWVRGVDVEAGRAAVVTVTGGSRPRAVVALDHYAERIVELSRASEDRLMIGGSTLGRRNVTTPTLDRAIRDASLPRLVPGRLRSTWLVTHLSLATPLSVLLPAAGLISARTIVDLLEFAPAVSGEAAVRQLAGRPE